MLDVGVARRRADAGEASFVGVGVVLVALPLLATDITRDPTAIAGVLLAMRLPWLVCSLVAGAVVDRVDRRQLIWRADLVRASSVAR
jgi:MFS family permease